MKALRILIVLHGLLWLFALKNGFASASPTSTGPTVSFVQPAVNITYLSYSERLHLVKSYIDADLGQEALTTLKPLMRGTPHYEVMLLAAQCYAELGRPDDSIKYYQRAYALAASQNERDIARTGIKKLQHWINDDHEHQSIQRIKQYLYHNKGRAALTRIQQLRHHQAHYETYLLTAQAYAELQNPQRALHYYQLAQSHAQFSAQSAQAQKGINKMRMWLAANQKKHRTHKARSNEPACRHSTQQQQPSCARRIRLARQYLSKNQGKQAIQTLQPLLNKQSPFETHILAAQAYAEDDQPELALAHYESALSKAKTSEEQTVALFGMGRIEFWLGHYAKSKHLYQCILNHAQNKLAFELATAGKIKSLAYADRPILAYRSIPPQLKFTTPNMVIAAAQATLWADQADLTKNILTTYQPITQTIDPQSALGKELRDIQWQAALNTHPNVFTPSEFYFEDSEHFSILRTTVDYKHYWSQQYQSFVGFEQTRYKLHAPILNAEGVYLQQKWRPTRQWTLNGKLEPTTYQLWNPFLWLASANYQPNDYFGTQWLIQREVITTFPAFAHHITSYQYAANVVLSPMPYFNINAAVNSLQISDSNVRNGYFIAATGVISNALGLNLTIQRRGYTDKFISPYYFSPNQYSTNTVILRLARKTHAVWHYYIDGGIGNQNIGITENSPMATSPTQQIGLGLNGPLNPYIILNVYYAFSRQAAAFLGSPDYRYHYGAISLNILL